MTTRSYRAWRFVHPDVDTAEGEPGLRIAPTGAVGMAQDDAAVRQALLLLLSTSPGERVMRPEYGCELKWLLFAPNDDTTAGLAIHYVRRAVQRWEPRVEILRLDAHRSPEAPDRLDISLEYRVRATQATDRLGLQLDLAGGLA